MKRILCYGDSNTWGYDPEDEYGPGICGRFPADVRWTGVMQNLLGPSYCVLEEGLNGRTTVYDDAGAYGRNGLMHLEVAIRTCDPVDLIILMLGTNDAKDDFHASIHGITNGMARLIRTCHAVLPYTRSGQAKILVAAPLKVIADQNGAYQYGFSALSTEKGEGLRNAYRELAQLTGCAYFDVNDHVEAGLVDGVHLDAAGHRVLGKALAETVRNLVEQ